MRHNGQYPYASEAQTKALLRFGSQYRLQRIQAADMITTDEAAAQRVINLAASEGH